VKIKRGSTSVRRLIFIADSSSTTGAGLPNLTSASAGLNCWYYAGDLANDVQMPLVPATLGSFTPGGFVAVDNTNLPGWYELGIENAALDGGNEVAIMLKGAANMAPVNIYIELDSVNYQDATAFGLSKFSDIETDTQNIQSRLPTALSGGRMDSSVGAYQTGLAPLQPTTAGRTLDVSVNGGAGIDWSNVENPTHVNVLAGTVINGIDGVEFPGNFDKLLIEPTGHVTSSVDKINNNTITASAIQGGAITAAKFAAGAIDANALNADAAAEIANAVNSLQVLVDVLTMINGSGTALAKWSTNALSLAPTGGGGGGTGTGARTVNITVQLSGAAVQGAKVRLTKAGETYLGTTNVSGIATFNIDDGSWIVSITSPNTTFAGAVLAVSGTVNQTYSLTAIAITPSSPGNVTGYWLVLGANGLPETGVTMSMQAVSTEHGSTGLAIDTATRTAVSDAVGVAQFSDLTPGVRYQAWRGTGAKVYVTIPADSDPIVELNSLLGSP